MSSIRRSVQILEGGVDTLQELLGEDVILETTKGACFVEGRPVMSSSCDVLVLHHIQNESEYDAERGHPRTTNAECVILSRRP